MSINAHIPKICTRKKDSLSKTLKKINPTKDVTSKQGDMKTTFKTFTTINPKMDVTNKKGERKTKLKTFTKLNNKQHKALYENNRNLRFWNVNFKAFFESDFEMILQWNITMNDDDDYDWSISSVRDEIWIGGKREIRVYSKAGDLMNMMEMAAVQNPRTILKVSDEDIFIIRETEVLIIGKHGKPVATSSPLNNMQILDYSNDIIYGITHDIEHVEREIPVSAFKVDKNAKNVKYRWKLNNTYTLKCNKAGYSILLYDFMVNMKLKSHPQFFLIFYRHTDDRYHFINYDLSSHKFTRKLSACGASSCNRFRILATDAKLSNLIYWIQYKYDKAHYAVVASSTNNVYKFDLPKNVNRRLLDIVCDEEGFYWTLSGKVPQATITKYKVL